MAGSRAPSPEAAERLRALPSVEELAASLDGVAHVDAVRAARAVIGEARARILSGTPDWRGDTPPGGGQPDPAAAADPDALADAARAWLAADARPYLRRVVNASGVIVHTNLGRAPLADSARAAVARVAEGYS
ncbi:MAG TPA: hypothetical protein VH247_05500, partial [Thermoleophilaceae bacterium]|nr:hypothetical protein [Thermoleophilaceae bacterium]